MISIWPSIYYVHVSFVSDMERLLTEALMWPVAIWMIWVLVQRRYRKQRAAR